MERVPQVGNPSLRPTDEYKVIEIISVLNKQISCGFVDISVLLSKEEKFLIGRQLTNAFNDSRYTKIC